MCRCQSYVRLGEFALIRQQRYAHAGQFKQTNRQLRQLRTYFGKVIRHIACKTRRASCRASSESFSTCDVRKCGNSHLIKRLDCG